MRREGPNPATAAAASARKEPWKAPRLRLILGDGTDGKAPDAQEDTYTNTTMYTIMGEMVTYDIVYMFGS